MKEPGSGYRMERSAATLSALAIVGMVVGLLIRNEPIADPRLFFALRVVVSVAAAVLGAAIPGFLQVRWSRGGLAVRAGGALALFVLTFVYTPDLVTAQDTAPANVGVDPTVVSSGAIWKAAWESDRAELSRRLLSISRRMLLEP
ncbi:hypothetical protein J2847_006770 [Azospirillum agricola]|uniref:hypothetical protein n=1 Tax=Azospirillum agricola TaxID=1720247 RepID=UPI001AEA5E94|nr:hypothetical protein [Azospirillum agricola]MBP2233432.1 hypothetical protein [Azospirillum agricola]